MKETTQLKQQNQTFQLSVNRHHHDKTVGNPKHYRDGFKTKELTIKALAEAVKRGHAWSCATYDRSMRSKGNYQQGQLIGLDIDNGLTLDDALNHPFVKQYGQLIYTSASHQKPKGDTPPCDRFRIVFSASQPIKDIDSYEQLVKAVMGHFHEADEACKDASRYWAGNSQAEIFILDGDPLPASLIEEASSQAKIEWEAREKRRQETLARVNEQNPDEVKSLAIEALNFIPPRQPGTGTYQESLRVLMALTTIFGQTEAIAIAEAWSPPMKGWNPARKIQGFRVGKVTAGTLFWIAQQHGFKFPERQRHSDDRSPIEPDHHAYQSYVQWEKEQETLEEIITNERKINRFRNFLGKKLKKLNPRKSKKYAKINPFNQGESYKGSRIKAWLKALKKGFNVLANDFMGSGKTYDVLKIINPEGRVIYLSKNHRNPSI
ncbi:MAG: PriCT-2 domain-containing protein, partial [Crocosphaera sp.]